MQIILVSDRLATAKTITLKLSHLLAAALGLITVVLATSSVFSLVTLQHAAQIKLPLVQSLIIGLRAEEAEKTQEIMRDNLNVMAVKLGQMQAQLVQLDFLGERLGKFAGLKPSELRLGEPLGRGGPFIAMSGSLTPDDLERQVDKLSRQLESRGDYLGMVESQILDKRAAQRLLPTTVPVATEWDGSGFGYRVDPFTGERALHSGVDFQADVGTPIIAAAGGVVVAAEYHPQYGHMVDIDHGSDLLTRYAHASKVLREARPARQARAGDRRGRLQRALDRTAPALRGSGQWRTAESQSFSPADRARRNRAPGQEQVIPPYCAVSSAPGVHVRIRPFRPDPPK